ncbi:hypothetical protein RFM51_28820 [Mesorhizobium sp. VK3E]|uniref:Cobalamin-independent methionine synthase MetE C-terminal/archaeal domain-containing protein n=1 Tax=Mesorhizobium australafricanum TaxID=3072311 RepID=A0ABU4X5H5_9HYPH|nr:hypothetical protein [Mesorhizobium sp. VK3E]MDX8443575.1 hypothetical protein [Mesorhizobium sp. VK3E]
MKSWLAFAAQKTDELVVLAFALAEGRDEVAAGVYDIHSPGIPEAAEISNLIKDPGAPAPAKRAHNKVAA